MAWHYQLMKHETVDGVERYAIHECYELEGGNAWTDDPVAVDAEHPDDIIWMLDKMLSDVHRFGVKDYGKDEASTLTNRAARALEAAEELAQAIEVEEHTAMTWAASLSEDVKRALAAYREIVGE